MSESEDHREEWRAVVGYNGLYEVSSLGRLRSLRSAYGPRANPLMLRPEADKTHRTGKVRYLVRLRKGDTERRVSVASVMLAAFRGPRPRGMQALHWDDDATNNVLSNLRWGTPKENAADRTRNGMTVSGERHSMAKLSSRQVEEIRRCLAAGEPQRPIARRFGVHQTTISLIRRGVRWASDAEKRA